MHGAKPVPLCVCCAYCVRFCFLFLERGKHSSSKCNKNIKQLLFTLTTTKDSEGPAYIGHYHVVSGLDNPKKEWSRRNTTDLGAECILDTNICEGSDIKFYSHIKMPSRQGQKSLVTIRNQTDFVASNLNLLVWIQQGFWDIGQVLLYYSERYYWNLEVMLDMNKRPAEDRTNEPRTLGLKWSQQEQATILQEPSFNAEYCDSLE